jgi:hypothetical protein
MSSVRRSIWRTHRRSLHVVIIFLVAVMNAEDRFTGMLISLKNAGATLAHSAAAFLGNRSQDFRLLARCESRTLHMVVMSIMPPFTLSTQWAAKRRLTPLPSQGWRGGTILSSDRCAERKDSVKFPWRPRVPITTHQLQTMAPTRRNFH